MKNNQAIVLYKEKLIVFKFKDILFVVDLAKGDLEDSWYSISLSDKEIYDTNFSMEDTKSKPSFYLYECNLVTDKKSKAYGLYEVSTEDDYKIDIIKQVGTKAQYFK